MKLPVLKHVEIQHLSLYNDAIKWDTCPGINMIIGGNGIGKTTLINTILFALVGNAHYERLNEKTGKIEKIPLIESAYFHGRIEPEDQDRAQVTLTFGIDNAEILITRALYRPRILQFIVKDPTEKKIKVFESEINVIEEMYQTFMVQMLGIREFEHFVFLIANLLLFDEARRTLAWDSETQNTIIRLLFLESEFDERFSELSARQTQFDTQARHKSETRKDLRKQIQDWLKRKAEMQVNRDAGEIDRQQAELHIAELHSQLEWKSAEVNELESVLDGELERLQSLVAETEQIELERGPLEAQLEEIEREFYSRVYQRVAPEYIIMLESLSKYGSCKVCGTQNTKLKKLGDELKRRGQCIICRSAIDYSQQPRSTEDIDLISRINSMRERLEQLNASAQARTRAQTSANIEIKSKQDAIAERVRHRRSLEANIAELRIKYLETTGTDLEENSDDDPWLSTQRAKISELDIEVDRLYDKSLQERNKLKILNEKLLQVLHEVNQDLTPLFSDYASRFLGTTCELVVSQKTRNKKPLAYMYPRFYDKDRKEVTQVSESQRFFLDQAFRMALISWFVQTTGWHTFYIVETPEGSLDLAYEQNVADMFLKFGEEGHSIIITSNLNSSNFLGHLYKRLGDATDRKSRTLDLLQYGRLSQVQQDRKEEFNQRMEQLELPLIWTSYNGLIRK